ncbi:GtrA family protein [Xylocopilactobacillus apicola]|uniref:Membrane protein n=1 Tax=Xylocopilactobacillus apicola TaxID=2932184 RepID=A0AAU9DV91_9LACO|nr:GtrA family protein [Xylocopilactobacillus apicola]BDR57798.1 membrane protein [Xylocopilactobacillus apicola]
MDKFKNLEPKKKEIITYLIFGILTTAVNYIVFFALTFAMPEMKTVWANTIAWFISFLFAFFTNRKWVFNSKAQGFKARILEFWWFLAARTFSLFADDLIVYLGIDLMQQNKLLVKLISQILIVLINYVFSKWIFKSKN